MKLSSSATNFGCFLAALCLAACSTVPHQLGSGDRQLTVGQQYALKREAILLAHRGVIDSIENPDYTLDNYKAYKDYSPYDTQPIAVLPTGTVLVVKKIRVFKSGDFDVQGEILSGRYKRQPVSAYDVAKGFTVGGWPPTGKVMMQNLCGGRSFDPGQLILNLSKIPE
jgi:hypothetical protein